MHTRQFLRSSFRAFVIGSAYLSFMSSEALGQTQTWTTGNGGSGLFSNTANWVSGTAPVTGNGLVFGTTTGATTLTNDLSITNNNPAWSAITFNAGAPSYTITGSAMTMANGALITNNSGTTQTINTNFAMGDGTVGNRAFSIAGAGNVVLGGALTQASGYQPALTMNGSGMLTLNGTTSNTMNLVVNSGTVLLAKTAGATAFVGYTGGNQLNGGVLRLGGSNQFGNDFMINGGTFDLNGFNSGDGSANAAGFHSLAGVGGVITNSAAGTGTNTVAIGSANGYGVGSFGGNITDGSTAKVSVLISTNQYQALFQVLSGSNSYTGGTRFTTSQPNYQTAVLSIADVRSIGAAGSRSVTFDTAGSLPGFLQITGTGIQNGSAFDSLVFNSGRAVGFDIADPANTFTLGTALNQGAGIFTKRGAGTMVLTASSSYTGATNLQGGVLRVDAQAGGALASTTAPNFSGGTLSLLGKSSGTTGQALGNVTLSSGGGAVVIDGNGGGGTTLAFGTLADSANAGSSLDISIVGSATATTTTTSVTNGLLGNGRMTFRSVGNADFAAIAASGTPRVIQAATYTAGLPATPVASTNYSQADGATLTTTGTVNALKIATTLAGQSLAISSGQMLSFASGGLLFTGSNDYAISGGSIASQTATNSDLLIHQFGSGVLTVSSTIANGIGASTLTKTGPGALVLSASNAYTGQTYVNGGTLSISANQNLGAVATGATLNLNGGTLQATASVSLDNAGSNKRAVTVGSNGGGFDVAASGTLTISGVLNASGMITKSGSGVLLLSSANTVTGGVTINEGVLLLGSKAAIESSYNGSAVATSGLIFGAGASPRLQLNGNNTSVTALVASNTNAVVESASATAGTDTITVYNGANNTFAGILRDGGTRTLALGKTGGGTLFLTNTTSSFSGGLSIYNGVVSVSQPAIGSGTVSLSGGGLQVTGSSAVSFTNPVVLGPGTVNAIDIVSSTTTLSGVISGAGNLTKTGTGTLALGTSNTYTGTTIISQGAVRAGFQSGAMGAGTTGAVTLNGGGIVLTNANHVTPTWAINVGAGGGTFQEAANGRWGLGSSITGTGALTLASFTGGANRFTNGGLTAFGGKLVVNGVQLDNPENSWGTATGDDVLTLNGATLLSVVAVAGGTIGSATQGIKLAGTAGFQQSGNSSGPVTIAAKISGSGVVTLMPDNGSSVRSYTIANTGNSWSGGLTITNGVGSAVTPVKLGASEVIPNGAGKGDVALNGGGIVPLDLNGFSETINGLTASSTASYVDNTAPNTSVTLTVGDSNATSTYQGQLRNSGSNATLAFVKIGSGTITLSGSSSFTGGATASAGRLTVGNAAALGTGTATVNGGELFLSSFSPTIAGFTISSGSLTGTGKLSAATYRLGGGTVVANLGSGTVNVTASAALNGTSDATALNLNAGTLTLGSGSRFTSSSVAVSGSSGASLALGGNETFGSLAGSANVILGSATLTTGSANTTTNYAGTLSGAGGLTKVGSGTFTLSGANTYAGSTTIGAGTLQIGDGSTMGGLSSSSAISISSGATFAFNRSDNYGDNFANAISGSGGVTLLSGSLTFSNAKTYTGQTRISAGVLALGVANAIANQSSLLVDGGAFNLAGYDDTLGGVTITSGSIFGSGKLTAATYALGGGTVAANLGAGTLRVTGNSSLTGSSDATSVNLDAGALTLGSASRFTSSSVAVSGSSGASLVLGGNEAFGSLAGGANVSLGSATLTTGSDGTSTTYSGTLAGTGGLTKVGSGTFTLSGVNTYGGATQVTAGLLRVDAANAISGSSAITLGGATTRGFLEIDAPLTISSLTFSGSGGDVVDTSQSTATFSATSGTATITVLGGSNAFHAAATLASPTLLDISNGAIFTFHNNISGSATFTKQGLGTLNIVGDNDGYSGSFNITGGRVNIGSGMNQIGTGTTTLSGGSVLDLGGQAFTDRVIVLSGMILNAGGTATTTTISGTATISGSTAGTYNITSTGIGTFNAAVGNGAAPVNVNVSSTSAAGGQAVFNDVIAGQGNVVVNAGGTATFNGAVSGYTITHGVSTFNAAYNSEAQVQSGGSATFAGATGTASNIVINAGGAGTFSGAVGGAVQVGGAATFTSASSLTGNLTTNSGGVATFSNMAATVASAIHNDGQLVVNRTSGTQTISGAVTGSGSLVKQGAGVLALSGSNTFSGATTVSAGVLAINGASALQGTSGVGLAGGSSLRYTGGSATFDRNVTVTAGSGTGTIENTGGGVLTLAGNLSKDNSVLRLTGGSFNVTGVISGATPGKSDFFVDNALVTFSNVNTYDGPTYVSNSGTLALGVANVIPNTSAVTLGDATTRGTLAAGTFTDTIASLTTGAFGGTVNITVSGATAGGLSMTNLTLGGSADTLALSLSSLTLGRYSLLTYTGLRSGTFDSVSGLSGAPNYSLVYGSGSNGSIDLVRNADQTLSLTPAASRVLVGGSTTLAGMLVNTTPSGGTSLAVNLSSAGTLTANDFSSSTGATVAAGGTSTITATLLAGNTAGSQNWSVVNTDSGAITTTATSSGSISVVNQRTFTVDTGTVALGTFLRTLGQSGSATVSSSGLYDTTASATLVGFSGTSTNGFGLSLASGSANFAGGEATQQATYALSGSAASAGAIFGSFTSPVTAELGSINPLAVALTGTALDPARASFAGGATTTPTLLLNFGSLDQNTGDHSLGFDIYNLIQTSGYTADLALLSTTSGTGNTGTIWTDLTTFNNLAAGSSFGYVASISTANVGEFLNTYTLSFKSATNGAVFRGDTEQTLTLTVKGIIVVPEPGALAIAGIGVGLAGWMARNRRLSRRQQWTSVAAIWSPRWSGREAPRPCVQPSSTQRGRPGV